MQDLNVSKDRYSADNGEASNLTRRDFLTECFNCDWDIKNNDKNLDRLNNFKQGINHYVSANDLGREEGWTDIN